MCHNRLVMYATGVGLDSDQLAMSAMGIRMKRYLMYWCIRIQSAPDFRDEKPEAHRVLEQSAFLTNHGCLLRALSVPGAFSRTIHKWTGQSPSHACPLGQSPSTDCL